jgi:hypothetical protein
MSDIKLGSHVGMAGKEMFLASAKEFLKILNMKMAIIILSSLMTMIMKKSLIHRLLSGFCLRTKYIKSVNMVMKTLIL